MLRGTAALHNNNNYGGSENIALSLINRYVELIDNNEFDDMIIKYMKKKHGLLIGERTAEEIKINVGSVYKREELAEIEVRGRDLFSGLPKNVTVNSEEIREALEETVSNIVVGIRSVLEETPPELASDISDRGIVLTGGGSLIYGLDKLITEATGMKTVIAEDAMSCVAIGTGAWVEYKYANRHKVQKY